MKQLTPIFQYILRFLARPIKVQTCTLIVLIGLFNGSLAEEPVKPTKEPVEKARHPAFEKFAEPKTIHEHYVNNLFDAADKFYDTRKDVPLKERADFYGLVSTLAADEKVSTVSRKTMILEREAIPMFESYLEKMGPKKTKEFFQKYAVEGKKNSNDEIVIKSRVSEFTELVTVKKLGMENEFNDIVMGSFNKAVDEVSAKKAQDNTIAPSDTPDADKKKPEQATPSNR